MDGRTSYGAEDAIAGDPRDGTSECCCWSAAISISERGRFEGRALDRSFSAAAPLDRFWFESTASDFRNSNFPSEDAIRHALHEI